MEEILVAEREREREREENIFILCNHTSVENQNKRVSIYRMCRSGPQLWLEVELLHGE